MGGGVFLPKMGLAIGLTNQPLAKTKLVIA
jgi:hypothetical protein